MSTKCTIIKEDGFGVIPTATDDDRNFEIVKRYTLTNKTKASVTLITWGAGVQSVRVPNSRGILGDVVLGFDDIDGYWKNRHIGRVLGRVTRRVSTEMRSSLSPDTHNPDDNFEQSGFDNVNWNGCICDKYVVMSHISRSHSKLYPGAVLTQVKYSWTDKNELIVDICATCTKPTAVDIAPFCLFNLAGHGMGPEELKRHVVSLNVNKYLFSNVRTKLPTGSIRSTEGTMFDLQRPTELNSERLDKIPGGGYDHFFCVNSPSVLSYRFHARVLHPESGRFVEVYSDQPGLHFYTANELPAAPNKLDIWDRGEDPCEKIDDGNFGELSGLYGKDGVPYTKHGGCAISPHNYPDSMNFCHFPSNLLLPGREYRHNTTFKFGVKY